MHTGAIAQTGSGTDTVRWPPIAPTTTSRPPHTVFPLVPRAAAAARLEAAVAASQVTLVHAPPGAGKTVLAAAWAMGTDDVTWLCLGHDDAWPGVFWWHLLDALSSRLPEWDQRAWPRGPDDAGADAVDALALALGADSPGATIVLDEFERVVDPRVLEGLDRLLGLTGAHLRLVLLTRTRPALPVHRYRLDGRLAEVGAEELRLDEPDVAALLAQHGLRPAPGAVRALSNATDGWAAGVRLAALTLQDLRLTEPTADEVRACLAPAGTLVGDYLRAEVVRALSADDLAALRRLSVVDGFGPGLAEALTGRRQDVASLTELAHRVPFLRRDGGESDFRLHPLVRTMLYESLRADEPGAVRDLHRRSAAWALDAGDTAAAVGQLIRAGDHPQALRLVVNPVAIAEVLLPTPVGFRLTRHLADRPDDDASPRAALVDAAVALASGRPADAADRLATVAGEPPDRLALSAALVRARLGATFGEVDPTLAAVAVGRHELGSAGATAAPTTYAVLQVAEASARFASGDLDTAAALLGDTLDLLAADDLVRPRLECLARLALVEACRGHLSRALQTADSVDHLARTPTPRLPTPAAALLARAWVSIERQELSRARHWLGKAGRVDEPDADPVLAAMTALLRARSSSDRGDVSAARRQVAASASAPAWLRAGDGVVRTGTSARVHALLTAAEREGGRGHDDAGRRHVLEALRLAEPERLRRPFTHAGPAVHAVMRSDPQVAARAGWLAPADAPEDLPGRVDGAEGVVDIGLTDRELEVLRHLEDMLSTHEIGAAMFISVNTVRTHVRHILHKLAVTRRNEAVRRARALGLL